MSKGNRVVWVAFGGLIGATVIIAAGWWYQPRLEDIPEPAGKAQAEADEQRADYDSTVVCNDDCEVVFDFAEAAEAPSGEHDANQSDTGRQSSENWEVTLQRRDLLAQERMAHWALWLAGLTAVGVVLIAGTFWEAMEATKAANKAAAAALLMNETTREIGQAQVRGYVTPKGIRLLASDEDDRPKFEIAVANCGATPVYELRIAADVKFSPRGKRAPQRFFADRGQCLADAFSTATIPANGEAPIELKYGGPWPYLERASRVLTPENYLHYFGFIFYRDVFGQLWEQDFYYLIFKEGVGEFPSRNFTLDSRPRKIDDYANPKKG